MKVEIELSSIEGHISLLAGELKEMLQESETRGFARGKEYEKDFVSDREKQAEKKKRVNPHLKKPSPIMTPSDQEELLNSFLSPQVWKNRETRLAAKQGRKDGYAEGYKMGFSDAKSGKPGGEFNPAIHIDKSIYGYTTKMELKDMGDMAGTMEALRDKNNYPKGADIVFIRITPLEESK